MQSPRQLFLENKDFCKAHSAMVKSDAFEVGVIYALAGLSKYNPSAEMLRGANMFIEEFVGLAEPIPEENADWASPKLVPPEKLVPLPTKK